MLLQKLYPSGLLGLGLAALLASFMSGMAGNVTAFNTVWTYDIYQTYIKPGADDAHYLWMGRMATVFGTLASIGTAYVAMAFNNIMDLLQLVFSFINAPLFATFLLGMFWKRTTANGAFWGLLGGTGAAAVHYALTGVAGAHRLGWLHSYPSDMAQNFWGAIYAWTGCFVLTIADQLLHPAAGREGPRGPRLLADAEAVVGGPGVVPPAARSRRHRAGGVGRAEPVLLVNHRMSLDLRVPIGLFFGLTGLLLAGYGLVSDPAIYRASLGINVNLWWGLVLVLFGGAMLGSVWLAARKRGA